MKFTLKEAQDNVGKPVMLRVRRGDVPSGTVGVILDAVEHEKSVRYIIELYYQRFSGSRSHHIEVGRKEFDRRFKFLRPDSQVTLPAVFVGITASRQS